MICKGMAPGCSCTYDFLSLLKHSLMHFFRSSPFSAFAPASLLHTFIFSRWVIGAGASPLRHVNMRPSNHRRERALTLSLRKAGRTSTAARFEQEGLATSAGFGAAHTRPLSANMPPVTYSD